MLGPLTEELINSKCPPAIRQEVCSLLSEKCSLGLPCVDPGLEGVALIDRIQLAAIRRSEWKIGKIKKAVKFAQVDWRDLLMASGFGESLTAHKGWQEGALSSHETV